MRKDLHNNQRTSLRLGVSNHTSVEMDTREVNAWSKSAMDQQPVQGGGGGIRECFIVQKPV